MPIGIAARPLSRLTSVPAFAAFAALAAGCLLAVAPCARAVDPIGATHAPVTLIVPAEEGENDRSQQRQESDDAEERVAEDHPSSPPAAMAQVRSAAMPISIAKA